MPTRKSPSQIQAELRRLQQRQRQAINNYNRAVDKHNSAVRRAVGQYNSGVRDFNRAVSRYNSAARTHNAQVRANRARLGREVARLGASSTNTTVRVTYRTSVEHLAGSFQVLERSAEARGWEDSELLAASSTETANSYAALNALLDNEERAATDADVAELQSTSLGTELASLDDDLDARWQGALFALNPRNPDAARHFCTSAREMLTDVLALLAPNDEVLEYDPTCERTDQGTISRRARIRFCVRRSGLDLRGLSDFVEADIENVLTLFGEFNSGTHGAAGRYTLAQLKTLKSRVEDAVLFVLRLGS